jgi:transposase InsO family protein
VKARIEEELREHPAYGSRSLCLALHFCRQKIQRVMRKFGIKPYRRVSRKWRRKRKISVTYSNLLLGIIPSHAHHVWATDFTEMAWRQKKVYVATVIDLFTRQIVGLAVSVRKGAPLVLSALWSALFHYPRPEIFHSDNGREYEAKAFVAVLEDAGSRISRSHPGCPW